MELICLAAQPIRSVLNSFIVANLIGADPKFCKSNLPLRSTTEVCASICQLKTKTNRRGSAQVRGTCQNPQLCNSYNSYKNELFGLFKKDFFLKWVCSIIFLKHSTHLPVLRALCLVKLLSVRTTMENLAVRIYQISEEQKRRLI